MRGRFFDLRSAHGAKAPSGLEGASFGLGLVGAKASARFIALRDHIKVPCILDSAASARSIATSATPLDYSELTGMLGPEIYHRDALSLGAAASLSASCYIEAHDTAALEAVAESSSRIDSGGVIASVALDVKWLRNDAVDELIEVLRGISRPVALTLGGQFNPTDAHTTSIPNLRRIYRECGHVGLWRVDVLVGFDAMVHGALFAGIGNSGTLRHLVPPDEKPRFGGGGGRPAVYIPKLMQYFSLDTLTDRWTQVGGLICDCPVCEGRAPTWMAELSEGMRAAAADHNLWCWLRLWEELDEGSSAERASRLADRIVAAVEAHTEESERVGALGAFKPSPTLATMAKLAALTPEAARTPAP
ncbi:hypothetical protein Afil01_42750 [Actinorhabdospora filicis]|uniref:Uncharacterized protein n=1 Tax=Actinorhabdospora filicis TaxID=1785913 RepID=A0A9W6SNZ1_9ACTN|nr:hypothetical protein Afil01_42750 [Actinorhabdospora filicis]